MAEYVYGSWNRSREDKIKFTIEKRCSGIYMATILGCFQVRTASIPRVQHHVTSFSNTPISLGGISCEIVVSTEGLCLARARATTVSPSAYV